MEQLVEQSGAKKHPKLEKFISVPLFKQSVKANWVFWLVMTVGVAAIFIIINIVIGSKKIFTNIDMTAVSNYVKDEDMSFLSILGLLETMGFKLSRISVMSKIDMNSVLNDLVYKIAGVILPMIYVMSTAIKLISAQVSDGSMAYVLSTPTNRKKVVRTQFIFLVLSLIAMYLIVTLSAVLSETIANSLLRRNYPDQVYNTLDLPLRLIRTLLYCFGSFLAIFALGGICFGASTFFNKSSNATAIGGGVCVLSFLCCILGLFGNKVFVSVGVGVEAMNFFNYLSIFTLIDTESMSDFVKCAINYEGYELLDGPLTWLWECLALFGIGGVFAFLGSLRFVKKDLPL